MIFYLVIYFRHNEKILSLSPENKERKNNLDVTIGKREYSMFTSDLISNLVSLTLPIYKALSELCVLLVKLQDIEFNCVLILGQYCILTVDTFMHCWGLVHTMGSINIYNHSYILWNDGLQKKWKSIACIFLIPSSI